MTYFSLLLRILLIVSISLNGYAAAAMPVGGMQAMHRTHSMATVPVMATNTTMSQACHEGMAADPAQQHLVDTERAHPASALFDSKHGVQADPSQPDDCCGQYRCQCDCSHAVAIVRVGLRLAPTLAGPALALPPEAAAPNGVSSLPIRPPIA